MRMQSFVSVIVPVLDDPEGLRVCLDALERQTYPADRYEVIVVDNGSAAPVAPLVGAYPHARAIEEATPDSFSARNTGIDAARGEVIAFTDADCRPASDWLESGVAALLSDAACGSVGGHIRQLARRPDAPNPVEHFEILTYLDQEENVRRWRFAATANAFVRRDVFDQVGPFDGGLNSGADVRWSHRMQDCGFRLAYAPETRVDHRARATLRHWRHRVARNIGGLHATGMMPPLTFRTIASVCAFILRRDVLACPRAHHPPMSPSRRRVLRMLQYVEAGIIAAELLRLRSGAAPLR